MEKLKLLLTSRKFWAALIGLIVVCLKSFYPTFPLSEEQLTDLVYLIVAFIVGTGLEGLVNSPHPSLPRSAGEGQGGGAR